MIIDKTIKSAAMFAAEWHIRRNLSWVMYDHGDFIATDSFTACIFNASANGDFKNTPYPTMGISDFDEKQKFMLDIQWIKKLKFYKNRDRWFLNDTMRMWLWYSTDKILFWRSDYETDWVVWVSKKFDSEIQSESFVFPDVKKIFQDSRKKCISEVSMNIEYLLRVAKAAKERGAQKIHISIWDLYQNSDAYWKPSWNHTSVSPVLFQDNIWWKYMVMPFSSQDPLILKSESWKNKN